MNAWSKLPNAKHIDWVLDSLKSNIDVWNQAYDQAWYEARDQVSDQARVQAWNQVYGVLLALIAYDDCDQYLSMTFDELKTWALVSEKPQAILLLPMKWVLTKI